MDQPRVAAVEALSDTLSVAVTWIDGTQDVVDLSDPIRRFTMLRPLADPTLFAQVKVVAWGSAIGWGDAEDPDIDYPADRLWQRAQDQRRAAA